MTGIPNIIFVLGEADGLKTKTLSEGAQKALKNFIDQYGQSEGERIFLMKAKERGRGKTLQEKVESIYAKGGTVR